MQGRVRQESLRSTGPHLRGLLQPVPRAPAPHALQVIITGREISVSRDLCFFAAKVVVGEVRGFEVVVVLYF